MASSRETHFTPKGVSIGAGPLAINIQPLRGCGPKLLFWHLISTTTSLVVDLQVSDIAKVPAVKCLSL